MKPNSSCKYLDFKLSCGAAEALHLKTASLKSIEPECRPGVAWDLGRDWGLTENGQEETYGVTGVS